MHEEAEDARDPSEPTKSGGDLIAGDDPITAPGEDRLDRADFAHRITQVIETVGTQPTSCVVGIVGPWGGGKTSVVNMVRSAIGTGEKPWDVVEFSAWMVANLESLVTEYFATLLGTIDGSSEGSLRKRVADLAGHLAPFGKIVKFAPVDPGPLLDGIRGLLDPTVSLAEQHAELAHALQDRDRPILVVVDDLDRLQADELLLVFKLIRLVGRLPNVHYLVAYDEETVLSVLAATSVTGGDQSRARAYLEKIVQYRFDLPPLHVAQAWDLFTERFDDLGDRWGLTYSRPDIERLHAYWLSYLANHLTTPRAISRYLTQLETVWPLVQGEVDFVDLAALTALRVFDTETYRLLPAWRYELTRAPGEGDLLPGEVDRSRWLDRLAKVGPDGGDTGSRLDFLLLVFPLLSARLTDRPRGQRVDARELADGKRAGSAEYFDRYVQLGILPSIDISDAAVAEAIRAYAGSGGEVALLPLAAAVGRDDSAIVRKAIRAWTAMAPADWGPVVEIAGLLYMSAPTSRGTGMSRQLLTVELTRILGTEPVKDLRAGVRRLTAADPTLDLLRAVTTGARADGADTQALDAAAAEELDSLLELAKTVPVTDESLPLRLLLQRARLGVDTEAFHDWVWLQTASDESVWTLDALLAVCVPVDRDITDQRYIDPRGLAAFDMTVELILGLDRTLDAVPLSDEPRARPTHPDFDISDKNRLRYATGALARLARARRADSSPDGDPPP